MDINIELSGETDGGCDTHLLILLLSEIYENLTRRMFNIKKTKDRRTVVGNSDILKCCQSASRNTRG